MNVMIRNSIIPIAATLTSIYTLSYIVDDNHKCQIKQQAKKYEDKIKKIEEYENKIKILEAEAVEIKKKYNYHLSEEAIKGILK